MTRADALQRLEQLVASTRHDPCRTCDCYQGFIVQLELDCDEDITDVTATHKVERDDMHPCLGCDPCPPGAEYAKYLKGECAGGCSCKSKGEGEGEGEGS